MKIRLVTQVEHSTLAAVEKAADRETRTVSAMANILIQEALAKRITPRRPNRGDSE